VGQVLTICIGAICDGSPTHQNEKVVVVLDRMITAGYPPIEFEHDIPKMVKLTSCCVCLCAGSALAEVDLLRRVKANISDRTAPNALTVVNAVKTEYINEKKTKAEEDFLLHKDLTLRELYHGESPIPTALLASLDGKIDAITINLEMLVCGVDELGAHIYQIADERFRGVKLGSPGLVHCWDSMGYHAIGSGELHAVSTFISHGYTSNFSLGKAIPIAFEAKKVAEKAPGVGKLKTDVAIITKGNIICLNTEHVNKLEDTYRNRIKGRELEQEMHIYDESVKEIISSIFPKGGT